LREEVIGRKGTGERKSKRQSKSGRGSLRGRKREGEERKGESAGREEV
jgi:hypothetical protein